MKIVHAVYSLEMGGAEVLVGQLARLQRAAGHDVTIYVYWNIGAVGQGMIADGLKVHLLGAAPVVATMRRYYEIFKELKPDVVHCHNVAPTKQAAIAARLAGVPCVISTRHRLELHPYDRTAEMAYNAMGWFCDWVTGICQVTCDNILLAPLARKSRLVRVYNGTKQVERVSIEKLGKRGFTVVFVGRLVREKDIGTLIKAVKIAREQVPGLELWLVGDGDDRKLLEAEAAELQTGEYVRFWGQQTETAQFFSAADVFAMSSISEGLPMSLLESMSLGTPAILTDVDGMGEVLRLTGSGMLVPVGDPQAFAEAIVRMAQDEGVREGFRAKALKAYAEQFTLERMADGYMELYRTRVAGGKST